MRNLEMSTLTEHQIRGETESKPQRWSIDGRIATESEMFSLCSERGLPAFSTNEAVSILKAFEFEVRPLDNSFAE
jgi:hypothetical protein